MHIRWNHIATAAALAACALGPFAAHATVLPYKDFKQLVTEADGIVLGTVRSVQAVVAAPGDINTFVTVDAQEVLSGRMAQRSITLKLQGGFDGTQGVHIDGVPQFAAGERVLLFVQGNGVDLVPFVGWSQGVFRVTREDSSGQDRVADADGQRVLELRGQHLVREPAQHTHEAVTVLGTPSVALARSEPVQASAGISDDGSAAVDLQATPARLPAMTLERFVTAVRSQAGPGRALQSVSASDIQSPASVAAERSAQPAISAGHSVANPVGGSVAEPMRRPADNRSQR